ncbi:hypothetical protein PUN28_013863 [Cardiocondyla obscurior]|uniref:Uncharacterized protein n=1 Tax=Cardiocondyla obscurior TaxID=286306 RepID=A0AAW2F529_9HYME
MKRIIIYVGSCRVRSCATFLFFYEVGLKQEIRSVSECHSEMIHSEMIVLTAVLATLYPVVFFFFFFSLI